MTQTQTVPESLKKLVVAILPAGTLKSPIFSVTEGKRRDYRVILQIFYDAGTKSLERRLHIEQETIHNLILELQAIERQLESLNAKK